MIADNYETVGTKGRPGISHALAAVDGSPASLRAVNLLGRLLSSFPNARLTVMYVAPLPRDLQFSGSGTKLTVEFPLSSLVRETAGPVLKSAFTALGSVAHRAESEVQVGEPAREICEYARSSGVDLIVMGTRGTGDDGVGVGAVSHRVVARAHCPVLVVP